MKLLFPLLMSMLPAASVAQSQLPSPHPNNLNLPFVLSVIGACIASFVVVKLYVWPTLRSLPRYNSLPILASVHAFRFLGMNFIVIGFVSPALSSAVGDQIAWGDFVAAVLALFSIAALTWRWAFAIPIVWILNLWGTADLLNAYYKGVTQVADVGLFGAAIYIPALFVPDTAHRPHACLHASFEARRRCGTIRQFTVAQSCSCRRRHSDVHAFRFSNRAVT